MGLVVGAVLEGKVTGITKFGAFVDLFAGDVDFEAVAKSIAKIGYDDYITLEMLPNYKQFPEMSLYADKYAMDKISDLVAQARGF